MEVFIFIQKVKQAQAVRINRVRDEELQIEQNILELFVNDLLLLKYSVKVLELEEAYYKFNLDEMAQIKHEQEATDNAFQEIVQRMSYLLS